jgi:hypothetical protein
VHSTAFQVSAIARLYARTAPAASPARLSGSAWAACSELVALEPWIGEQRLEHRKAGSGRIGQADGDRTVELDHRR